MLTKRTFHRVGNHFVNKYEVRRVELLKGAECPEGCVALPKALIVFKDGTKITVTNKNVPAFICFLQEG